MIAIYIILCHDGTFYTGITKDIKIRWQQHQAGKCRYTKKHSAKKIVYVDYATSYSKARKIEQYIKQRGARSFLHSKGLYFVN